MLRSCRSVVITSEVRVTRSRLNCSSRWAASATSATVPRPTASSACSRLRISSARLTARSAAPELDVLLGEAPVLLLDRPDLGHDLGLEPPDGGVGVEPGDHDRGPVGLQADRRAGGLAGQRGTTQQGLGQA